MRVQPSWNGDWGRPTLVALLLGLLAAPGATQPVTDPRPDILVVTVDTLRPDALGWVAGGDWTPAIDRLAAQGIAFSAAVSPAPLTLPAHTSMFSGLLPRRHGVRDNHQVVGPAPPLLAERLAAAGYTTGAVVSGFPLTSQFGLDRGFDHYDDRLTRGDGAWLERPAAETAAAAREWLAGVSSPWFLWVHFYDPHFPYAPPAQHRLPGARGAYDGEVAWVDTQLDSLLKELPSSSSDSVLTVFAGDHGEALGGHGEGTHGFFIYDETVLVPLVFRWPGRLAARRSAAAVRLLDVAPTLLDLLGLPPWDDIDGVSLVSLLSGEEPAETPAYIETMQPWNSYGWAPLAAVRHQGWKLIAAPSPELYDLTADPDEAENLFGRGLAAELTLRRELRAIETRPAAAGTGVADGEALAKLRSLGYLGTPTAAAPPDRSALADPKEQLELRDLLTRADEELRQRRFAAAVALLRQALERDPDNRFASARLGLGLIGLGDMAQALNALARAVELAPEDPETRVALAELLTREGRPGEAVGHWLEVVRLQPERAVAWSNLGAALGRSGQTGRAAAAYRRAAELEPEDPGRWTRLAFALFGAGETREAIAALERAAAMTPQGEFAHAGTLGLLLLREGRPHEARDWLARSRVTDADFLDARLGLVRLLLAAGERDEAGRLLAEGIARRPELRQMAAEDRELRALLP